MRAGAGRARRRSLNPDGSLFSSRSDSLPQLHSY